MRLAPTPRVCGGGGHGGSPPTTAQARLPPITRSLQELVEAQAPSELARRRSEIQAEDAEDPGSARRRRQMQVRSPEHKLGHIVFLNTLLRSVRVGVVTTVVISRPCPNHNQGRD